MTFFYYEKIPIVNSSIECPLSPKGSFLQYALLQNHQLIINSLEVPLQERKYPDKYLVHSKFVKGLPSPPNEFLRGLPFVAFQKTTSKVISSSYLANKSIIYEEVTNVLLPVTAFAGVGVKGTPAAARRWPYLDDDNRWKYKNTIDYKDMDSFSYALKGKVHIEAVIDCSKISNASFTIDVKKAPLPPQIKEEDLLHNIYYEQNGKMNRVKNNLKNTGQERYDLLQFSVNNLTTQAFIHENHTTNAIIALEKRNSTQGNTKLIATVKKGATMIVPGPIKEFLVAQSEWLPLFESVTEIQNFDPNHLKGDSQAIADLQKIKKGNPGFMWYRIKLKLNGQSIVNDAHINFDKIQFVSSIVGVDTSLKPVNFIKDKLFLRMDIDLTSTTLTKTVDVGYNNMKGYYDSTSSQLLKFTIEQAKSERTTTSDNTVFLLYNDFVRRLYYTPTDSKTPLIGSVVGDRSVEVAAANPNHYKELIANKPLRATFSNDAKTKSLNILIKDIAGRDLDVVPEGAVRLPARNILLEINAKLNTTTDMLGRRRLFSAHVLVSQEQVNKPLTNPTHANINNVELLSQISTHLAGKGNRVTCKLTNVIIPTKFTTQSNFLFIEIEGWTFSRISYINNVPTRIIGFVNTSKIENFSTIQQQNVYYSIDFGKETDVGTELEVNVLDMYDIKNFTIEIKDASNSKPIQFEPGKYPMFNFEFTFY